MTQTLTTDRLKQIASGDAFICTQDDESVAMARELLTNREAQPVAEVVSKFGDPEAFGEREIKVLADIQKMPYGTKVYTAPPAPVVNPEFTGETAVPEKPRLAPHIYRDLLDMLQEVAIAYSGTQQLRAQLSSALSIHVQPDHQHTRAAMLAQPVSQGCKLNSPETPDGWVACKDRMPEDEQALLVQTHSGFRYVSFYDEHTGLFYDTPGGNLMNSIEHILVTHWMPLPAAPEGGNGA